MTDLVGKVHQNQDGRSIEECSYLELSFCPLLDSVAL